MALRLIIIGIRMRMRVSKTGFLKSKKKITLKWFQKANPNRFPFKTKIVIDTIAALPFVCVLATWHLRLH